MPEEPSANVKLLTVPGRNMQAVRQKPIVRQTVEDGWKVQSILPLGLATLTAEDDAEASSADTPPDETKTDETKTDEAKTDETALLPRKAGDEVMYLVKLERERATMRAYLLGLLFPWRAPAKASPLQAPWLQERLRSARIRLHSIEKRYGPMVVAALALAVLFMALVVFFPEISLFESTSAGSGAPALSNAPGTNPADASGLSLTTRPAGATVLINRDTAGRAPLSERSLAAGRYRLSVQKKGYLPVDTVVTLGVGQQMDLSLAMPERRTGPGAAAIAASNELPPPAEATGPPEGASTDDAGSAATGTLQLTSQPAGTSVQLDGKPVGETPLRVTGVPAGTYTVTLQSSGYQPRTRRVTIEPARIRILETDLTPLTGSLQVTARPWGNIYVDGELKKKEADVRYTTTLPVGRHRVAVVHPRLGRWEETVRITADEAQAVTVDFNGDADAPPAAPSAPTPRSSESPR